MLIKGNTAYRTGIRSSESGIQSYIDPQGTVNVSEVDVQDNNNLDGVYINPLNSMDRGNNDYWFENTYTIEASAGAGGTIDPTGSVNVLTGNDQSFTITADPNYHIVDVLVDTLSIGITGTYTLSLIHISEPTRPY